MRPWQFSKPKTPGFGISRGYYLSVLMTHATLPSIVDVVNPRGDGGAVVGLGVPLGSDDKSVLNQPLKRGVYAVATKDRKTVMRMVVVSKEEAGYDPEPFAMSAMERGLDPELIARARATWTLAQLTFESHDPMVYEALDFQLSVAVRLALLTEGLVADPIGQRYLMPHEVFHPDRVDPRIDARDHISAQWMARPDGIHAFTLGMQKFSLPELEITGLLPSDETKALRFLMLASQSILLGDVLKSGALVGPFEVREGGFDRVLWEGIPVMELLPPKSQTASEALNSFSQM